ncbi:hypothetical protein L3X38_041311 [Prunus dulcis]|uniref:Calcium-binding EF-hand family protein n=1 Tax=Prunus dulcis TaxID=3755 RepID=A0AAD4USZ7_PRUDU|nr:hypothetical protein L3X38_041311 [Prunus dulcis]
MRVFNHHKNSDGRLSKNDLTTAFRELGSKWPATRAWFAMRYADVDYDGSICTDKELRELVKVEGMKEVTFWCPLVLRKTNLNPNNV